MTSKSRPSPACQLLGKKSQIFTGLYVSYICVFVGTRWQEERSEEVSPAVVLQCVAMRCSVLQCVAVCCSVLECIAMCCSVLLCAAVCCSVLQCVAVRCSALHV